MYILSLLYLLLLLFYYLHVLYLSHQCLYCVCCTCWNPTKQIQCYLSHITHDVTAQQFLMLLVLDMTPPVTTDQSDRPKQRPVSCRVSPWSKWSECSAKCGKSYKYKRRTVTRHPLHGGRKCPRKMERRARCKLPRCKSQSLFSLSSLVQLEKFRTKHHF